MGCQQTREGSKHQPEEEQYPTHLLSSSYQQPGKLTCSLSSVDLVDYEPKPVSSNSGLQSDFLLPVYGVTFDLYPFKSVLAEAKKQESFYDKDFPGTDSSIYSYKTQLRKDLGACDWKKPWEYMDQSCKTIQVFEVKSTHDQQDDIEPNDIKQGNISDCYFLSALSGIADVYPNLIRRLFITQQYQGIGLYCLYLNVTGHWRQVVLDDRVPCFTDGGPIFSRCHGNELWVVLMEKAYAKSYLTYGNIESGYPGYAFHDLTGAPADYLIPENGQKQIGPEEAWQFIESGLKFKYILAASSEKAISGVEVLNDSGIVSEHCYAILDSQKVKDSNGRVVFIVKMRNPWGHKEWSGDWGDDSPLWTEDLKVQLKVEKKDDGIFWIARNDFVKQFNSICVCKIHPNYLYTSYQLTTAQSMEPLTKRLGIMRVFKNTHGFITVSQHDTRIFPRRDAKYGLVRILVCRIDLKNSTILQYVGDKLDSERDVYVEGNFTKGEYVIYVEVEWNCQLSRDLVLSCYSEHATHITEVDAKNDICSQVLDQTLSIHEGFNNNQCKDYGDDIKRVSGLVAGYLYFNYKNNSPGTTLNETIQMANLSNLQACPPLTQDDMFKVEIRPKQTKLIKYRVTKDGNGAFGYQTRVQFTLQQQLTNDMMIQLCKTKAEKSVQRRVKGEPIEVYFSIYNHQAGTAFLYQNKTNKTFNEDLTLKLKNLQIDFPAEAPDPNLEPLRVAVPPGGEFLVSIKTVDPTLPTSYSMSMTFQLK